MMTLSLEPISPANYRSVLELQVAEHQRAWVADNTYSLAQAFVFHPRLEPFALVAANETVGFAMIERKPNEGVAWIHRLMVGQHVQRSGYGRAALLALLDLLRADSAINKALISFEAENTIAERLYAALGFTHTGEIIEGEVVMALPLTQNR